jgi:hypothetical protein
MFSNKGNYEKIIVRFSGISYEVSCTGENIVAVAIYNKHEVVFVNVITNTIINTVDIGMCACNSTSFTRLVQQCFSVTYATPNLETYFTKDSNSEGNQVSVHRDHN